MHRLLKQAAPRSLREARYRYRRLGAAKSLRYYVMERSERRKPPPTAGQPFDIGGGKLVPHSSTLPAIRSHWVEYAHGIQELQAFRGLAPRHNQFLDIGAAEGIYSAAFCALTGRRAWALEPSCQMYARLRNLCALNPTFAIGTSQVAVGSAVGKRAFRLYADGQFSGTGQNDGELMDVTTLDKFIADRDLAPDFAKIDVEGMELDVLRGGEDAFRQTVQSIMLEIHYDLLAEQGQSTRDIQSLLFEYGFKIEDLHGAPVDDLERFSEANPEPLPGYTIVVCRRAR
jgi:FkbM family methyltransferase